jgi:LysM repeat protein
MKQLLSFFIIFFALNLFQLQAQSKSQAYINYINNYYPLAIIQQEEHGIPASITLAQGLLESGAGQSELANKSNNHFGIKCHDWTGEKTYHDDDERGECFRKYEKVLDSYEDHSLFLKNRSRYAFLFELSPTDYQSWAHGLKKAGYATDPSYAYKLISIIENYELHQFDLKKTKTVSKKQSDGNKQSEVSPIGSVDAFRTHEVYRNNGVKFVVSVVGDTYSSLAEELNISEKRLRRYNEINEFTQLTPGTQVYIQYKKRKAARGNNNYVVKTGDSMYSISQNYAIKIEKLYQLNQMPYSQGAKLGQVLKLR